jgi:hypothetical protein
MTAEPRRPLDADLPPGVVFRRAAGRFLARHGARLLLAAAVLVFALRFMPHVPLAQIDTETVLLPLVYQDIVTEHHPAADWRWSGESSLVPDDIGFFLLRFLGQDDWFALEGMTVFFFLALVAACVGLARATRRPHALGLVTLLVLLVVAQACDFTPGSPEDIALWKPLFATVYHAGTALFCLLGFALLLAQIRGGRRAGFCTLLVLIFVAVISDFLFIVAFVLPAVLAAAALAIAFRSEWKRHLRLAAGLALSATAAFFLAPHLFPAPTATSQHLVVDLNGLHNSLGALQGLVTNPKHHYFVFLIALDIATVLAALAGLVAFCFFPAGRKIPAPVVATMVYAGAVIACDWGAAFLTGGYAGISENRYLVVALLLPLFLLAFGLHAVIPWRPWLEKGVAAAAGVFILVCTFTPPPPSGEYLDTLKLIPQLQDIMRKNHIQAGLITYWSANLFTFLSHGTVTLRAETADGSIVGLQDTMRWYGKGMPIGEAPRFRLVFPEYDTLRQKYGAPDQVITLPGGVPVWIYSEARAIVYNPYFDQLSNQLTDNGRTLNFPAAELPCALGQTEGSSRVAAPGAGDDFITLGPNIALQPGHYRAVYRYQYLAPPDPAHPATYDLLVHRPDGDVSLHAVPLAYVNAQPQVLVDDFTVTEPGLNHEMRIRYHDSGTLRVEALSVTSPGQ